MDPVAMYIYGKISSYNYDYWARYHESAPNTYC